MRRLATLILCLALVCVMAGCEQSNRDTVHTLDLSQMFTANDQDASWDETTATTIPLANKEITIREEGDYILSGQLEKGQIIIDAGDSAKIRLALHNVTIHSDASACIYVKSADKVFVTLADGSKNTLSVSGQNAEDNNKVDGVIFSKSDLTFNGNGALQINADEGHGIVGKDDVVFTGGTYDITAKNHGITANDSIRISDGTFQIQSGKDGMQADNKEDVSSGFVYIANGKFTVNAGQDGISASGILQIDNGAFDIVSGGGYETGVDKSEAAPSIKGIKSNGDMLINGGEFNLNSADDSVHSKGNLTVNDGSYTISTGDDGIHADGNLVVNGGTIHVENCTEGLEGLSVTINDGDVDIMSSDDGINASDGTAAQPEQGGGKAGEKRPDKNKSFEGGMPPDGISNDHTLPAGQSRDITGSSIKHPNKGERPAGAMGGMQGGREVNENCYIKIAGGTVDVSTTGRDADGMDSNGNLFVSGGTLAIYGNAPLDYDGTATITGGTIIGYGSGNMAQNFGDKSTQGSALIKLNSTAPKGSQVVLTNDSNEEIFAYTLEHTAQCILISHSQMIADKQYRLTVDGIHYDFTLSNYIYSGSEAARF